MRSIDFTRGMDLRISVVSYATGTTKVWTVFALLETRSMCVMRWCNVHLVNYDMLLTSRGCVTDGGSESNPQEAQTCSITFKTTSKQNTLLMTVNCSLVLPPTILTFGSAISTWLYTIVSLSAVELESTSPVIVYCDQSYSCWKLLPLEPKRLRRARVSIFRGCITQP